MSRRYWSNEPSSYDDFLLPVAAIRTAAPCAAGPEARDGEWSAHGRNDQVRRERWGDRVERRERTNAGSSCGVGLSNPLTQPRPADVREPGKRVYGIGRIAVINHHRAALEQGVRNEAPIPAVQRVVPIVSQGKVVPFWDDQRTPVVTGGMVAGGRRGGADEIVALPSKIFRRRIHVRLRVHDVALGHWRAISDQCSVAHLECVPGHTDAPLDEILRRVLRELEYDHVADLRIAQPREALVRERNVGAVDQLVDEQKVADLEGVLHAAARNLECFDEEGPDDGEHQDRDDEDLQPVDEEVERRTSTVQLPQRFDALRRRDRARRGRRRSVARFRNRHGSGLVRAHVSLHCAALHSDGDDCRSVEITPRAKVHQTGPRGWGGQSGVPRYVSICARWSAPEKSRYPTLVSE